MKCEEQTGLPPGAAAASGTIAYGDDAQGRWISETQPNANLASYP